MIKYEYLRFTPRGDPAAELTTRNEVLYNRELCFETDTGKSKIGDGITAWNDLPYLPAGGGTIWRTGSGAPSDGLGVDGDYYLNAADGAVYAKDAGTYTLVANIRGADGDDGDDGDDGREVEVQNSGTHIQWRYVGDPTWIDLVALTSLKGDPGDAGVDGGPSLVTSIAANTTLDHTAHANRWVEVTNGAEIKLPATSGWPAGGFVELCQADASAFTIVADTGVDIAPFTGDLVAESRYQGGAIVAKIIATDTWRIVGALADA